MEDSRSAARRAARDSGALPPHGSAREKPPCTILEMRHGCASRSSIEQRDIEVVGQDDRPGELGLLCVGQKPDGAPE